MKWKAYIMEQWVIYRYPKDYPDKFVVRRWWVDSGEITPDPYISLADTIQDARLLVPPGLWRLPRFAEDEVQIEEVWL